MSNSPTIAISLLTMNRKEMLRETIRTLLNQTRQVDEIFISDNSDEPDTTLISDFPGAPITYYCHDRRLHIEEHWGWAMGQPKKDYVMCMEDDNILMPNHVELFYNAAVKYPEATLFGSAALVFSEIESRLNRPIFDPIWRVNLYTREAILIPRHLSLAAFFFGTPFASSTVMVKTKARDMEGEFKDTRFRNSHDRWRWAQFAALGDTVYIPEFTMLYRVHAGMHTHGTRRAQHIAEGIEQEKLMIALMQKHNINPAKAIDELSKSVEESSREQLAVDLLRGRTWENIRDLMPYVLQKPSFAACIPEVLKIIIKMGLRKLRR